MTARPGDPPISYVDLVVTIPPGITEKEDLLRELSVQLRFPSYFGGNWDALDDCMRDLSWLDEQHVLIVHRDLPLANDPQAARTYLDVMQEAHDVWYEDPSDRALFFVFPSHVRAQVERVDGGGHETS